MSVEGKCQWKGKISGRETLVEGKMLVEVKCQWKGNVSGREMLVEGKC